ESLADGIGSSYGVIGYKGKVWSLRYKGEHHTFTRADDGSPITYIDVIILRQAHEKSKSFYEDYDPNASEGKRPICASLNGITPDTDVTQPQSASCAVCPRNVWKTDANGRKTRECTDYKRLAVLLLPNQTRALLGSPLMEPVFLRVPPASLNDLSTFGETMRGQGWHYSSFVTRISFDPTQPHPKMQFRPLQELTDAEGPVVLPLRNDPMAKRITGEDQTGNIQGAARPLAAPAAATAITAQPAAATLAPAATPATVTAAVAPPAAVPISTGLVSLTPAPTAHVAPAAVQPVPVPTPPPVQEVLPPVTASPSEPAQVSTGLLDLTGEVSPPIQPATTAAPQTTADIGEATEADDVLDAALAKFMPKTA
ncbi:MAG TPA: hypothetical protein VGQ93_15725, partial [Lysobacter sp.]|nr:hypothetical protein [Lysobacter sp.]